MKKWYVTIIIDNVHSIPFCSTTEKFPDKRSFDLATEKSLIFFGKLTFKIAIHIFNFLTYTSRLLWKSNSKFQHVVNM